jgi:hypothetical protein
MVKCIFQYDLSVLERKPYYSTYPAVISVGSIGYINLDLSQFPRSLYENLGTLELTAFASSIHPIYITL